MNHFTDGNTIQGRKVPGHIVSIRGRQVEVLTAALSALRVSNIEDTDRLDAIYLIGGLLALAEADEEFNVRLHNAAGARPSLATRRPAEPVGIVLEPGATVAKAGSPADLGAAMSKAGAVA